MWGGYTKDYRTEVTEVEVFNPHTERWIQYTTKGYFPTCLRCGAATSVQELVYTGMLLTPFSS